MMALDEESVALAKIKQNKINKISKITLQLDFPTSHLLPMHRREQHSLCTTIVFMHRKA